MAQNCSKASFKWGKMGRGLCTGGFLGLFTRVLQEMPQVGRPSSRGTLMLLPNIPVSARVTSNRELVME